MPSRSRGQKSATHKLDRAAGSHHVSVVCKFGDLPPEILFVAEGEHRIPDRLEIGISGRNLRIKIERSLETRVHDGWRESAQLRAGGNQSPERRRIDGVIA